LKSKYRDYLVLFLIAGAIILFDQLTKHIVRSNLTLGEVYRPDLWLSQIARIVHWKNSGAAFGMFQSMNTVITVLSFVVSGVILYYFPQVPREDWLVRLAMGMLLGGAVGNLIDRLSRGYVTDFFSVGPFPVFNIADASISTGVVILFIGMWMQERNKKEIQMHASEEGNPGEDNVSSTIPEEIQAESTNASE